MPTTYDKSTLSTFFQTNDVPQGSDYENLIYSQVNIVEATEQVMGGNLNVPKLITARISAGTIIGAGGATIAGNVLIGGSLQVNASALVTNLTVTGNSLTGGDAQVNGSLTVGTRVINTVAIISATGTTQATAALASASICRIQGVTNGSDTGILLASARTGWEQTLYNETATSANLWPTVGGSINGGSTNAALAIAGNTQYSVTHLTGTTYSVK